MNQTFLSSQCRRRLPALVVAMPVLFLTLVSSSLHGQSMDYGALEQLFKEPVTTSVTGSPQRVSDVPATMEIITAEDIRRSGAKDIPRVLRHVGGVDTLEWGNDDIDVGVRGYNQSYSARLLVLVDGRQVYADGYGYTPWITVPVELGAIRQIEIIKGPNCALFGFNAVDGVINIITYDPLYDHVNSVSAIGGTQDMASGSAVATHSLGSRAAVRLLAGGDSDSDFSSPVTSGVDNGPRVHEERSSLNLDGVVRLNDKMALDLEASRSTATLNEMLMFYQFEETQYDTDSVRGRLTAESRLGLLQATVYSNWIQTQYTPGIVHQSLRFANRVTVAQFQDIIRLGSAHILRAAVEYRHNAESSAPISGASIGDNVFAVNGMWNWKMTPTLTLTNALRLDAVSLERSGYLPPDYPFVNSDWSRTYRVPSFNSGVVWRPQDRDALRFMAGRGAELPNLFMSGAFLLVTPIVRVAGTPQLQPTVVTNYELGWDHALSNPHLLLFRASAFYQESDDVLALIGGVVPTPLGPYMFPSNVGKSYAVGLELQLKGNFLRNYRWAANYRPEQIRDHFVPGARNGADYVDYQHTIPLHLLKGSLGWANKKWELDGYLQYQSTAHGIQATPAYSTQLIPIAAFASVDARVGYQLTERWTWAVSGQNLTHASQIQTGGPAVERRVLGTMSFRF
jgi:outer membrane receptor for ferrienterochelin and colicins